jgi:hypothetical protein
MSAIGDILKRKGGDGPAVVKIVAVDGRSWIVAPQPFGPPLSLSGRELAEQYGGDNEPAPEVDEARAWASMADRPRGTLESGEPEPLLTPEEKLATEAQAAAN